jgi:hypothetical protein
MAAYGSRNTSGRVEGKTKKKNTPFYLKSSEPLGRPTLLAGTEEEQLAAWKKSPKKKGMGKLLAKAAKARAKRK